MKTIALTIIGKLSSNAAERKARIPACRHE